MLPLSKNHHHTVKIIGRKSQVETKRASWITRHHNMLCLNTAMTQSQECLEVFFNKTEKQSFVLISDDICLMYFNIRRETAIK